MNLTALTDSLSHIPRDKSLAFATRAALRLMPLLSTTGDKNRNALFTYWGNKKEKHLFSVFRSNYASLVHIITKTQPEPASGLRSIESAAKTIMAKAVNTNNLRASFASNVALALASCHFADDDYTKACAFCGLPWEVSPDLDQDFLGDIETRKLYYDQIEYDLKISQDSNISASDFVQLPLWNIPTTNNWNEQIRAFRNATRKLRAGFDIWLDWYDDIIHGELKDIRIMETAVFAPKEILSIGPNAINRYFKSVRSSSASQPLNRVRAIFIGYGEAGKTSLIKVIHNEDVPDTSEPMTPGIEIREWEVPGTNIKALFWDFGGQVMVHATHQLFLRSSCLYVLVISSRNEINASEQAEYWLEHVKSFGDSSPVLIVGNRIDQADLALDLGFLKNKYPNIVGYFPISCTKAKSEYANYAAAFKQAFCKQLVALTTHQMMFTKQQFSLLQELQSLTPTHSFLAKSDFEKLCSKNNIDTNGQNGRSWLLDILDKLGIIIHFPQLPFADGYVLNPRWLTYGIYTLMYSKQAKLTYQNIILILSKERVMDERGNVLHYPSDKCGLIMSAMHEFKLSYPLASDANTIIIPALLPATQPQLSFSTADALEFDFLFESFVPRHLLPELIVSRHQEIVEETVWQTGVWLRNSSLDADALLRVDYHARRLTILVRGIGAREYLTVLRDELHKITNRISINFRELVTLPSRALLDNRSIPLSSPEKAAYRQLIAHSKNGLDKFFADSGNGYYVALILDYFTPQQNRQWN
jgi:small GTP-binding protein